MNINFVPVRKFYESKLLEGMESTTIFCDNFLVTVANSLHVDVWIGSVNVCVGVVTLYICNSLYVISYIVIA